MNLDITVQTWREGDQWVAHAMPIDVMSSGPTPQTAHEAVDEAVRCFVKTAEDASTLEKILPQCGYGI